MIMPRSVRRLAPIAAERKTEDEGNDFAAPRQPRRRCKLVRRLLTSRPAAVPLREGRRKRGGGGGGGEEGRGWAGRDAQRDASRRAQWARRSHLRDLLLALHVGVVRLLERLLAVRGDGALEGLHRLHRGSTVAAGEHLQEAGHRLSTLGVQVVELLLSRLLGLRLDGLH